MIGDRIVMIDRANGLAYTNADEICTITNFFDADGDETDDMDDAVAAVVRYDDENWFSIDLRQFERVRAH